MKKRSEESEIAAAAVAENTSDHWLAKVETRIAAALTKEMIAWLATSLKVTGYRGIGRALTDVARGK